MHHLKSSVVATLALIAAPLVLSGCSIGYLSPSYLMPGEKLERVREAASGYNSSLRFGYLEQALGFVAAESRKEFIDFFATDASAGLRFTDVEIQSVTLGPERDEARVLLVARMYRLPSVSELTISDEQVWRYDPSSQGWRITPDLKPYKEVGRRAESPTPAR
jgi:hypothetical protein